MAATNTCWGLELGSAAIKAVKLERVDETKVRALEYAIIQHPKVLSTPGVDAADSQRMALAQLVSQYDLGKSALAVSIPGQSAFARFTKLPPVEPKKVPDIVRFEAMQQVPFPLEEVEWDYQTFVSPDSPDVSAGIFAIRKDNVRERLHLLEEAGLTPGVLTLSPLAVYNALAYDLSFDEATPGTIIVDVGTTSTDIVIGEPGRMWVRTFPLGGHQFTEALVKQFSITYPKAEKLKREAEDTQHARQIFQAMRPVFTDLATEIQRSIGYYQALHKDSKLTRVIGVGSTFRLPGLRKYLKQQLGMEVYRVEEFKRLTPPPSMVAQPKGDSSETIDRNAAFNEVALNLVTAYGLAIQGLGLNACGGNLMPVSVIRESMWRDKGKTFAAAAGVALLAGAAFFAKPAMDHFAFKGRIPGAQIDEAIQTASRLKAQAQEAGVLGDAPADFSAANIVALFQDREIFPRIVDDLGLMFQNAQSKAPAGTPAPALALTSFETTYEPPEVESTDPLAGGAYGQEPSTAPADIRPLPRVKCVLRATTSAGEARRFVEDTLQRWVRENAVREGVPYRLVLASPAFELGSGSGPGAGGAEAAWNPALPVDAQLRGDRPQPRAPITRPGTAGALPMRTAGDFASPTASGERGGTPIPQDAQQALAELDRTAPIQLDQPGTERTMLTFTFYVAIPQPQAAEGGAM